SALSLVLLSASPALAVDASVPDSGAPRKDAGTGTTTDASKPQVDASTPVPEASTSSDASGSSEASTPADGAVDGAIQSLMLDVGRGCSKDSDCDTGLTCLPSTSTALGGGGPAAGLCTFDCSSGGQAACDGIDLGSICRPLDAT